MENFNYHAQIQTFNKINLSVINNKYKFG